MNSRFTDILLGLLFFGTLIGLGVVTIGVSDLTFIGMGPPKYDVEIFSPDVGYLRPGDPILLHGMPAGKVLDIQRMADPVNHVEDNGRNLALTIAVSVRMELDPYDILGVDHRIYIEDRGMLGGRLLRIEAGSAQPLIARGSILIARSSQSLWQTGTEVISENRASIREILEDLSDFTARVEAGDGLLGALMYDEELLEHWQTLSSNLRESSERLERGEGLLGRLLQDDSLYIDAQSVVDNAESITDDLKLVSERLLDVSGRMERGEGTLGRLFSEDAEVYGQIETIVDDIEGFTSKLNAGGGVLGTLVTDDQLADDLRDIIKQMRGLIEDARETSPVADVGSFLFGTF